MAATKPRTRKASTKPARDLFQEITDSVVEMLEAGTVPWHKPWTYGSGDGSLPRSMSTGKAYRGTNPMFLAMTAMSKGYESPWWGTYKQIMTRLGVVDTVSDAVEVTPADDPRRGALKGEKGTLVVFWKRIVVEDEKTGTKKPIFLLRHYFVFNADQVAEQFRGSLKLPELPQREEFEVHAEAELAMKNYFSGTGPTLRHGGNQAYYSPGADAVQMPQREDFDGQAEYYGTLFHEATHSTGHASRLDRDGITKLGVGHVFGSESYAKEELVAEMGNAFLSALTGVGGQALPNSSAYIQNWISVLKNDKKFLVSAAAQAQKAAEYILGTTPDYGSDED